MPKETKQSKKSRRPTAEKRMMQNEKRRACNKAFKSQVRTAMRRFEDSLSKGDVATAQQNLNDVYGLVDKGVKRGTYKLNTAARIKSRLTAKVAAKA